MQSNGKGSQRSIEQYLQPAAVSLKPGAASYDVDADGRIVVDSDSEAGPAVQHSPLSPPQSSQHPAVQSSRYDAAPQVAAVAVPPTSIRRSLIDDDANRLPASPNHSAQPRAATRAIAEAISDVRADQALLPEVAVAPFTRRRKINDDDADEMHATPNLVAQPSRDARSPAQIQGSSAHSLA